MQVVPFSLLRKQSAHKGWNREAVPAETLVYAVEHNGLYFHYGYKDQQMATYIAHKFQEEPNIPRLLEFNFRREKPSIISSRTQPD